MNTLVFFFLCIFFLISCILSFLSCFKTYKSIVAQKKRLRLSRYMRDNKGNIGEAQQWRCWLCQSVMLSNYEIIMIDADSVAAVCTLCASRSKKYQHIYKEDTTVKDSLV